MNNCCLSSINSRHQLAGTGLIFRIGSNIRTGVRFIGQTPAPKSNDNSAINNYMLLLVVNRLDALFPLINPHRWNVADFQNAFGITKVGTAQFGDPATELIRHEP